MVEIDIIALGLHAQLNALWNWRNNEHLFMLAEREYGKCELNFYNAAIITVWVLRGAIKKWAITQNAP